MTERLNIEKLIKLSLMALAITPLIVTHSTLFPFIFGKAVFIRLMIGIAGVLFAMGVLSRKKAIKLQLGRLFNPLVIAQVVFTSLVLFSTFLASNPFRAFWGNVERSEGFLILIYMLLFFLGTLLFFNKKDWLNFFKANLVVGGIISIDVLIDWLGGSIRPEGSFLDNPATVSIYALFVIFFALMVGVLDKNKAWLYLSWGVATTSLAAIFVAGTRGVIVGLMAAFLITLLRLAFTKRKNIKLNFFKRSINIRRLAIALLLVTFAFSAAFVFTRSNPVWQRIPGLDRIAKISSTDPATQTRLINIGISLDAINPASVGITKTLFGWGPEGYINAHNQFYNPSIQKFENSWFDRAHNKLLDVLVMSGLFGLLAYLAVWTLLFRKVFRVKSKKEHEQTNEELWTSLIIGGVAVAYFVQTLFFFDIVAIYVPLFSLLSFATYTYYIKGEEFHGENTEKDRPSLALKAGSVALGTLLVMAFIWTSIIPMRQMGRMLNGFNTGQFDAEDIEKITAPDNFIQSELRLFALFNLIDRFPKEEIAGFLPRMMDLSEGVLEKSTNKARREQEMGIIYNDAFKIYQNEEFLVLGEEHLRKAIELAPGRQIISFVLAENLTLQGRFDEVKEVMNVARAIEPEGLQIDIFYLSRLSSIDLDGVLERLKNLYIEEEWVLNDTEARYVIESYSSGTTYAHRVNDENLLRVINDTEIRYIRESYSNHISYAHRTKDEASLRRVILQTIEIEKVLREIIDFQAKNGIIKKSIDTREATFMQALDTLDNYGLDAIRLK